MSRSYWKGYGLKNITFDVCLTFVKITYAILETKYLFINILGCNSTRKVEFDVQLRSKNILYPVIAFVISKPVNTGIVSLLHSRE